MPIFSRFFLGTWVVPALVVNSQSMDFGRLTLVGDGAATIVSNGAVTSITLGTRTTGSDHFTTSGATLVPTSVPSDVQYVWTGCTASGPGGTSGTFTLTINTLANTYSYATDSDVAAILAIATATTAGKTFLGRAGSYVLTQFNSKAWASETTLGAHDPANKPVFYTIWMQGTTSNLTLDGIEVYNTDNAGPNVYLIDLSGTVNNIKIKNCVIHGLYFDPTILYEATTALTLGIGVSAGVSTITIEDNEIYQLYGGGNLRSAAGGTINFNRNTVYEMSSDCIKFVGNSTGAYPVTTCNDNLCYDVYGSGPDDHLDFIQFVGGISGGTGDWTIECKRNRCIQTSRVQSQLPAPAGATSQGIFGDNLEVGSFVTGVFEGNFCCTSAIQGITFTRAKAVTLTNNTVTRCSLGVEQGSRFTSLGEVASSGTHVVTNCVSDSYSIGGSPTLTNNIELGEEGVTIPYSSAYLGISGGFIPATIQEAITMFSIKPNGVLDLATPVGAVKEGATFNDWSTVP